MKQLTLLVLIVWAVLLSYKESLPSLYDEVKQDMIEQGYHFGKIWYEDIKFFSDHPNFYGINVSMGSHASNITILINYNAWVKMNKTQKKLLILHEMIHSIGGEKKYHCSETECIMSPHSIDYWKNADYEKTLRRSMLHHHLLLPSRITILRN